MADASRDENFVTTLIAVSSIDGKTPIPVYADPTTHRLLTDSSLSGSLQTDIFTSTSNQTTFIPSQVPVYTIFLSVNGQIYTPSADYSLSAGNYVLTNPIPPGNSVVILYSIT